MKRLLLAGLLVLSFALARAEKDDAFGSLVGMAGSASSDKGPDAGEISPDLAAGRAETVSPKAAKPDSEAPAGEWSEADFSAPAPEAPVKFPAREAKRETPKDDERAVSMPAVSTPRVWTRFFSALLPPMTRAASFEVAASTAARRARPEPPREATSASAAGAAQGLLELVATATAPLGSAEAR